MVILLLHNYYKQPGGEDVVMRTERQLLESRGHEVVLLEADNREISGFGEKVKTVLGTIYSPQAKRKVAAKIAEVRPDIVHVYNFFPLFSPSVYYACREAGVPVAQTVQNYRLICPNAYLLRSGHPCEECVGRRFAWPGVLHACYRDSRMGTATVAAMAAAHWQVGTWKNEVSVFIAATEFGRNKLIEGGLPAEKIVVKPNFVPDPGSMGGGEGDFALFAGRLSAEKGIATLLSGWERLSRAVPLKVVGDGPLREDVARRSGGPIDYLGGQTRERVLALMRKASFLVFPSVWYEGLPMVIVEAFSVGLPVIASNLGSMSSLIDDERTGLHFRPGDADDLAAKVEWAVAHPKEMARMRRGARAEYLARYTPQRNYEMLMEIYARATGGRIAPDAGLSHAA
jgi:glycosyltransferase involved in cell wall biosynthesis